MAKWLKHCGSVYGPFKEDAEAEAMAQENGWNPDTYKIYNDHAVAVAEATKELEDLLRELHKKT